MGTTTSTAAFTATPIVDWATVPLWQRTVYVRFEKEHNGYSAIVLNLPGCVSQGDTFEEAMANVKEALAVVIESYVEDGKPIPWSSKWREEPRPLFSEMRVFSIILPVGAR